MVSFKQISSSSASAVRSGQLAIVVAVTSIAFKKQIANRNFLAPTGFKFSLTRAPKLSYFTNSANVPGISLGVAEQGSYLKMIPVPGDMMEFNDLSIRFLVDEVGHIEEWSAELDLAHTFMSKLVDLSLSKVAHPLPSIVVK